jgi:hypothetical protein
LELGITKATARWALLAVAAAAATLSYDSGDIGTTKYETQYGAQWCMFLFHGELK